MLSSSDNGECSNGANMVESVAGGGKGVNKSFKANPTPPNARAKRVIATTSIFFYVEFKSNANDTVLVPFPLPSASRT